MVQQGVCKWFNEAKGFGFIVPDDGSKDLFVHFKEIQGTGFKTLKEGDRVEFKPVKSDKGMTASEVCVIS
jgi:CspA family cold shock protein